MSPKTVAILTAGLIWVPLQPAAAFQCWTNSDGVRECGDVVPPEYAQKQIRTINERGLTVEVKERAKTKEELAEARRLQAEEERRRAAEEQRRKEQATYDRVLLSTFTTEQELLASRDRKIAAIDATIEVTQLSVGNVQESLKKIQGRAANLERSGRPIPDELKNDIASLKGQIADKQAYIENKRREKSALQQQSQADLERFRYLKSRRR